MIVAFHILKGYDDHHLIRCGPANRHEWETNPIYQFCDKLLGMIDRIPLNNSALNECRRRRRKRRHFGRRWVEGRSDRNKTTEKAERILVKNLHWFVLIPVLQPQQLSRCTSRHTHFKIHVFQYLWSEHGRGLPMAFPRISFLLIFRLLLKPRNYHQEMQFVMTWVRTNARRRLTNIPKTDGTSSAVARLKTKSSITLKWMWLLLRVFLNPFERICIKTANSIRSSSSFRHVFASVGSTSTPRPALIH